MWKMTSEEIILESKFKHAKKSNVCGGAGRVVQWKCVKGHEALWFIIQ